MSRPTTHTRSPFIRLKTVQRDLPTRVKRKLHAIGGGRGVWSLPVRQTVKINGSTYEKPTNLHHAENDSVIISTDANPSPGLSRVRAVTVMNRTCLTPTHSRLLNDLLRAISRLLHAFQGPLLVLRHFFRGRRSFMLCPTTSAC